MSEETPRNVVLFLHGFMGSTAQFDFLLPTVARARWDVCSPTLPGHGAGVRDFAKHGAKDWAAAVETQLVGLRNKYDNIVIVAHSMGGLLALAAASKEPDRIARIIALALPLRLKLTLSALKIRLASLRAARAKEDARIGAARELCGVAGVTAANLSALVPNTMALFALIRASRKLLRSVRVPLTAINSSGDEMVAEASLRYLERFLPSSERIRLERSSHFWFCDEEKAVIANTLKKALV